MSSYCLADTIPQNLRDGLSAYDPLTQQLLFVRGITTDADAERFFAREYESALHDPFLLPDMDRAVDRIVRALDAQEHIAIYSDYDCDGIPGGVVLHDFLRAIGYVNFENYIPHRHFEGYGVHARAIDTLKTHGASLMITVDCGIADGDAVAYAQSCGIDVIVTDHHEPPAVLPSAYAVVNPKRVDSAYPFSGLCGAGVAYKLVSALIARLSKRSDFVWTPGKEKWFLDVVGLATIADMVPLTDENRALAHYGLMVMRKNRRVGLSHLFRAMKMDARSVTEDDIGFMIAPRINAASRMGAPLDAFRLLATTDEQEALQYARALESINNERKGVVASMVKSVKHKLSLRSSIDPVLVVGDSTWRPSLVGLAANTLSQEYSRPAFVWGRDGNDVLKGSCRSNGAVSVVALMRSAQEVFHTFGGHHASGGFSVKEEHIHSLSARLNEAFADTTLSSHADASPTYRADAALLLEEVTPQLIRALERFTPFGEGNHKPLFLFQGVSPHRVERFGKQKNHTKLRFHTDRGSIEGIGFFKEPQEFHAPLEEGKRVDLLAHVEESAFGGRRETRLRIVDAFVG